MTIEWGKERKYRIDAKKKMKVDESRKQMRKGERKKEMWKE
jgi:hypothetical protein